MLKINLICVGKLKEKYLVEAFREYSKRIDAYAKFKLIEIKEAYTAKEPSKLQIEESKIKEGKEILKSANGTEIISMCIEGKELDSVELSKYIQQLCNQGKTSISFIIGGSWGLSDEVKENSILKLSIGKMTFPHQLFRIMITEQIYRSLNIINNGKYHK